MLSPFLSCKLFAVYCYTGKRGDFAEEKDQVLTVVKDLYLLRANNC